MDRNAPRGAVAAAALALLALCAVAPARARAEGVPIRGGAGFSLYADDQETSVWTPYVRAGAEVGPGVTATADYAADIISSASVDVVTAATGRMTDLRHQLGAGTSWEAPRALALEGGYTYSRENDALSHTVQAGARQGFFEKNLELGLRYGLSWNAAGVLGQPEDEWREAWIHSAEAGVTLVLDRRTEVEAVYSPFVALGYQANPYRRVPGFQDGQSLVYADWPEENVPGRRVRHAFSARVRRALGARWAAFADYRYYADEWGIHGHAVELAAAAELPRDLSLRLRDRTSVQDGADFYRMRYESPLPRYRTRDRRLGPMLATMGGASLSWETRRWALGHVSARASADGLAFRHDEFLAPVAGDPSRMERLGWILGYVVQLGIEVDR